MIQVSRLTKFFGPKAAVDDISFSVEKGEVLGFLGPNAAGKTTTMRMITGFLPPTSGTAIVGGDDIREASLSARKKIGYLPENAPVYPDMTVMGFLDFIAEIRGFSGLKKLQRIEETLERCFLKEARYQTINTLSKGFKQRVCFAQSILHDPPYLIMDEPTDGLDPNQKHEVRSMISEMAKEKTIILSTHNLEEVEAVCTRAIIIAAGKIAADETPEKLKARYNQLIRWVLNKEKHANELQGIVTQYFMTQRIKVDTKEYSKKLALLHNMLIYAMKCKQTADLAHVSTLRSLLKEFHLLYFGRTH